MSSKLPDSYIFKITGQEPKSFGTGFAIHSDSHHTYFVTCSHVLDDVGGPVDLQVGSMKAEVVVNDPADGYDIAVLRIPRIEVPIIRLNPSVEKGTKVSLNGFYAESTQILIRPIVGTLGDHGKITSKNFENRTACWALIVESEHKLEKGYSGSPVCEERSMCIVGIVNQRKGSDKGQVVSIEVLKIIWPECIQLLFEPSEQVLPFYGFEKKEEPLINFEKEVGIFRRIVNGEDTRTRFITLYGDSSFGKSRLLREFISLSEAHVFSTLLFDFKQQLDIEKCLETIVARLDRSNFPQFNDHLMGGYPDPLTREKEREWLKNLTRKFFADLITCRECPPIILFFDHYEKASQDFEEWLESTFMQLNFGQNNTPLVVVLAGQKAPLNINPDWSGQYRFPLEGLPLHCFEEYAEQRKADLPADKIKLLHEFCKGAPGPFVTFLRGNKSS
jgi:hypothetical protein